MRLLVVEDDPSLHRIIHKHLKESGYAVDGCYDGAEGLDFMEACCYDCVILDLMLPKMDGASVLKEYRRKGGTAPVLILTARDAISDRVAGLDNGADDYLTKPFAFDELLARIRALLRRNQSAAQTMLCLGDLSMDTASHVVKRGEKEIHLTAKEYALLEYLLRNQGIVRTRAQISDHIWNYEFDYDSNIVDVYIRYLRNKIDKGHPKQLIQTIRGFGYVMRDQDDQI